MNFAKILLKLSVVSIFVLLFLPMSNVSAQGNCSSNLVNLSIDLQDIHAFDINMDRIAIGSWDRLYIIDQTSNEIESEIVLPNEDNNTYLFAVAFAPVSDIFALFYSVGVEGRDARNTILEIRDILTQDIIMHTELTQQNTLIPTLSWSPNEKYIALAGNFVTGGLGESVRIWDISTEEIVLSYKGKDIYHLHTQLADWSPDGTQFAYADNLEILLWDTEDWSLIDTITSPFPPYFEQIRSLNWSNDNHLVVGADVVFILNSPNGLIQASWSKFGQSADSVQVSPDLKWVAQGGRKVDYQLGGEWGGVVIRNLETQAIVYEFEDHKTPVFNVEWASDSQSVFSASSDSVYQWDVNSGCAIFEIKLDTE